MLQSFIDRYRGTEWEGPAELWTDPMGNDASLSRAMLRWDDGGLWYGWSYDGQAQEGRITGVDGGIQWQDSWHQPEPVRCESKGTSKGIFTVEYSYAEGPGGDWSWRIALCQRPDGSLVLQMTHITPWGEEGRAVRMIFSPAGAAT